MRNDGSTGIGTITPSSMFSVGAASQMQVNTLGDVFSTFTLLDGSSTTTAVVGTNSTSLPLVASGGTLFDVGNYVRVTSSTACSGSLTVCYAKITGKATDTLTISPALSWAASSAVVEMHIPELGGVDLTQATANRYGRGYFIDGIVTGNGSTRFSDNLIDTTANTLNFNTTNNRPVNFGTGTVTVSGLTVTGTFTNSGTTSSSTAGNFGVGISTNLSRLTVKSKADVTNIGGTTTANASTTITGSGTIFTTSLGVGDRISLSSAASTYATVTAIASDTSLTVDTALGNGTSQTINQKQSILRLDDAAGVTKLIMNDLGNVGIGATSPASVLHIVDNTFTSTLSFGITSGVSMRLGNTAGTNYSTISSGLMTGSRGAIELIPESATNTAGLRITTYNIFGTNDSFFQSYAGNSGWSIMENANGIGQAISTYGATPIIFTPNRTERMRITSGGYVGINNNNPASVLSVNDGTRPAITLSSNGFSAPSAINATATGDKLVMWSDTADKQAIGVDSGSMWFQSSDSTVGGTIKFYTGATATERVRVSSTGNVGVGDTSPAALLTVGDGDLFQVSSSGNVSFASGATRNVSILTSGTGTAGNTLAIAAGAGGTASTAGTAGGSLTLSAGAATTGVTTDGGAGGGITLTATSGTAAGFPPGGQGGAGGGITFTSGGAGNSNNNTTATNGGSFTFNGGVGGSSNTTSGTAGNGGNFAVSLGAGGAGTNGITVPGGVGGAFALTSGAGGAGDGSGNGGVGGAFTLTGGAGGASGITAGTGGAGSSFSLLAGNGGNGTTTGGAGGSLTLAAGNSGTGGNANGGSITLTTGNKTGTGTIGKIDLQINDVSKLQLDADGFLNFQATGQTIDFASSVDNNTFIWKIPKRSAGSCTSATAEGIRILDTGGTQRGHICMSTGIPNLLDFFANSFNATSTDLAEMYSTRPEDNIEAGDVVEIDPSGDLMVRKTTGAAASRVVGVISTRPGLTLTGIDESTGQGDTANGRYVALKGRVPVKVSMENGPIAVGDYLISSSTPGVAMKATGPGMTIGRALDAATMDGTTRLFVEVGYWGGDDAEQNRASEITRFADLTVDADFDLRGFGMLNVKFLRGMGDRWSIDENGRFTAAEIVTEAVRLRQRDERTTIDSATLPSGESHVQVHNTFITTNTKVFVTFRKNPRVAWWVDEVTDGLFILKTESPVSEDVTFDYWLVGVTDERTPPPAPAPEPVPESVPESAPEPPPAPAPEPELVPTPEPPPAPEPAP